MRLGAIFGVACVLACVRPALAAPSACTAAGVFAAGDVSALYYWDLHDRAGEISGYLHYIAWNGDVDLVPSIRQVGALNGSRHGMEILLAVVDPLRPDIVRKVHAKLRCWKPAAPSSADSVLVFPIGPRKYDDGLPFVHISRAELAIVLRALTHGFGPNQAASVKVVRREIARLAKSRANERVMQERLRGGASAMLQRMAATTPQ
jgi:hypothetical protein